MEKGPVIKINKIIADTFWSFPKYHGEAYECNIGSVVIIFAHRWFFGFLITATSLEVSGFEKLWCAV
jgi:hypothetical protein